MEQILTQLKTRNTLLAQIPDAVLDTEPRQFRTILARREGQLSTSVYIRSQDLAQVVGILGRTLPTTAAEIVSHSQWVLIDLESVASDLLRFYLFNGQWDETWISQNYPFDPENLGAAPGPGQQLEYMGFLIDTVTDSVFQYKYYWWDVGSLTEYNYRFNPDGTLNSTQTKIAAGPYTEQDLELFNIQGLDFTGYLIKYLKRDDGLQIYMTIVRNQANPYTPINPDQGQGGGISELPTESVNPT